jgi:hypothetical protein
MRMVEFRVKGYDSLSREVRGGGRPSAVIHVPKSWAGKKVLVILLEPPTSPDVPLPPSSE